MPTVVAFPAGARPAGPVPAVDPAPGPPAAVLGPCSRPIVLVATGTDWAPRAAAVLQATGRSVVVAPDVAAARPAVAGRAAAVVVAQAGLAELLRHRPPHHESRWVPVVAVTEPGSVDAVAEALERGADDCVGADIAILELGVRLDRLVTPRAARLAPPLEVGAVVVDLDRRLAAVGGRAVLLSATQFDVLVELARHPGRTVAASRLLAVGWDAHQGATTSLLRPQLARLRKALGPAVVIRSVRGCGYVLEPCGAEAPARIA